MKQGCELGSSITPGWVESQAVLPDQLVPLAGFCAQAGPQAGLHSQMCPQTLLCDQMGLQAVP